MILVTHSWLDSNAFCIVPVKTDPSFWTSQWDKYDCQSALAKHHSEDIIGNLRWDAEHQRGVETRADQSRLRLCNRCLPIIKDCLQSLIFLSVISISYTLELFKVNIWWWADGTWTQKKPCRTVHLWFFCFCFVLGLQCWFMTFKIWMKTVEA